jgi:hypothetical protein
MPLTDQERAWLERIAAATNGMWPDRPFLRDQKTATSLMQQGLVELVKPAAPYIPYAAITPAGREALAKG